MIRYLDIPGNMYSRYTWVPTRVWQYPGTPRVYTRHNIGGLTIWPRVFCFLSGRLTKHANFPRTDGDCLERDFFMDAGRQSFFFFLLHLAKIFILLRMI